MRDDTWYELRERFCSEGFTYVVAANGRVKIGTSINPKSRIANLRSQSPVPLEVLALIPDYVMPERQAHDRWAHIREHGEWFTRVPELEDWLGLMPARRRCWEARRRRFLGVLNRRWTLFRPLAGQVSTERLLQRAREQQEVARQRRDDLADGCRICGADSDTTRLTRCAVAPPGLYCATCVAWIRAVTDEDPWTYRGRLEHDVERAQARLAAHEFREARWAQLRRAEKEAELQRSATHRATQPAQADAQ